MRYDPQGERKVLMQADQILYLHPREFTVWERDVAEGRAGMLRAVAAILRARGIAVSTDLTGRLARLDRLSADELIQAAQTCSSQTEFLALLAARPPEAV